METATQTTRNSSQSTDFLSKLYEQPLPSSRSGSLYNAFSYPTKISPEAIALFIATHTNPGETVLDTFAGSGTTGLAALLCDKPTPNLLKMAADLGINPTWGPRRAVLYELGVLGAFISETLCNPPDPDEFEKAARDLVDTVEGELGCIYRADGPDGAPGEIRHVIWSEVLNCPLCGEEFLYSDSAVKLDPVRFLEHVSCPKCNQEIATGDLARASESVFDPVLKKSVERRKRVPALIYGHSNGKNWRRRANSNDLDELKNLEQTPIPNCVPISEMCWGDLHRNGYHFGISHVHQFYTYRNLLAVASLWERISHSDPKIQNALRLLVLSYNSSHSTLMTRVVAKKNQKDFVLTGAQSGILYISSLPVEKNVFRGVRRKIGTLRKAFETVYGSQSEVRVVNKSSTKLDLANNEVHYVFTDPPFTDFIPYAELSQINEAWLGTITDRTEEVVVSRAQSKDLSSYGALMQSVFSEIARVLTDKGKATVVFHSAKASAWKVLADSFSNSGLTVKVSSVLDKLQDSFKQVVSKVSVKGDPLMLLTKNQNTLNAASQTQNDRERVVSDLISKAKDKQVHSRERTAERLYSRYISDCLSRGISVEIDAAIFYEKVRATAGIE